MPDLTHKHLETFVFDPHCAAEPEIAAMARELISARARLAELEAERDDARGRVVRMNEAHNQTVATLRESRARIAELEAELANARSWAGRANAEHREGRR